jgi:hypothetical protein
MNQEPDSDSPLRPNLGPEPWPETPWPSAWWTLVALPVVGLAAWRFHRARKPASPVPADLVASADEESLSPAERLVRLVDRVRNRLAERFGTGWAAMTTEELLLALNARLPIATFPAADAVRLFRAADLAKFAASPIADDHLAEAESAAARVLHALADGAITSENGR